MFCSSLKKHGTNTHKFEKRKMLLLTKEELKLKLHQYAANCYICWKRILKKLTKSKNLRKVEYLYHYADKYRSVARSSSNLKFNVTSEIPFFFSFFFFNCSNYVYFFFFFFHNGSNYGYHFITKESVNEFERQF